MLTGTSTYWQNKSLDATYRGQALPAIATFYIALLTCTNGVVARSTAYAANNTVVVLTSDGYYHLYKVTTAGTTASTAPSYPGVPNEVITDGTAVLTEQTSALDQATAIVEPSGGGYARVAVTSSLANMSGTQGAGTTAVSSGTSGTISNNNQLAFPASTAAWAAAPAMVWGTAVFDASTAGDLIQWGVLGSPQNVGTGVTVTFNAGSFTVQMS